MTDNISYSEYESLALMTSRWLPKLFLCLFNVQEHRLTSVLTVDFLFQTENRYRQTSFTMTTAAVFGSTGAVGGQILATLLASNAFSSVKTVSRRLPNAQSSKLQTLEEGDSSKWGDMIASLSPKPSIVFNAVGTTRAAAGGIQNQWKIDHDLCVDNARAAKAAGVKTYVFISSGGTRGLFSRHISYSKMKIGVEDTIKELDFEHSIILRPGLILQREKPKAALLENIVQNLNKLGQGVQDMIGMISLTAFLILWSSGH